MRARADARSGELLPFEFVTPRLARRFGSAHATVAGDRVYFLGIESDHLEVASLRRAGSPAPFVAPPGAPSLQRARAESAAIVLGSSLYVVGGRDASGAATASIERATIERDGTIGPFSDVGNLGTARAGASLVEHGRFVFVVGGTTDGSIERIPLVGGTTFTLPSEPVDGVTLAQPRRGASAVVVRNASGAATLYVVGGLDHNGAPLASVERAPLADDGTLGAFTTSSAGAAREGRSPPSSRRPSPRPSRRRRTRSSPSATARGRG